MHGSLDEFKFRPDTTSNSRVICPCTSEKLMCNIVNTLAPTFSIRYSSFFQVTSTTLKFDFEADRTKGCGVSCPWANRKNPIDLKWEKSCEHSREFIFNWIFFILAGDEDIHERLDEFQFWQICNGVQWTALDWRQNLVFAQYLENE